MPSKYAISEDLRCCGLGIRLLLVKKDAVEVWQIDDEVFGICRDSKGPVGGGGGKPHIK